MIGKIKGRLIDIENNLALIETTGGLSFYVYLTPSLILNHKPPSSIDIYTYLQVREDIFVLYGFESKEQFQLFNQLLSVPGVGPKTAYSVICFTKTKELSNAVKENNLDYFSQIPGLGKKTAMKIILELSQKLKQEFVLEKMYFTEEEKAVVEALVSLGFKTIEAKKIIKKLPANLTIEEKIKKALQML